MRKPICDMDCFHCAYSDCINDHLTKREYYNEYYHAHKDILVARVRARYDRLKAAGICVQCGQAKPVSGVFCEACKVKNKEYRRRYREKRRAAG